MLQIAATIQESGKQVNPLDVKKIFDSFVPKSKNQAVEVVKKLSTYVFSEIVRTNPIDTGYSQNSWFIGVASIPPKQFGDKGTSKNETLTRLQELSSLKYGDDVYLINYVHYVQYLERGHSKQTNNLPYVQPAVSNGGQVLKAFIEATKVK